jgi:hypothetical protein
MTTGEGQTRPCYGGGSSLSDQEASKGQTETKKPRRCKTKTGKQHGGPNKTTGINLKTNNTYLYNKKKD